MDLDLLDHLGASMLLNDKLTFLCKYREFHRLLEKREFVPAGDLLVRLLLSNTVPRRSVVGVASPPTSYTLLCPPGSGSLY